MDIRILCLRQRDFNLLCATHQNSKFLHAVVAIGLRRAAMSVLVIVLFGTGPMRWW